MLSTNNMNAITHFLENDPKEQIKELLQKPFVKVLLFIALVVILIYASRFLLNGAAVTIHAYKNFQQAVKRQI